MPVKSAFFQPTKTPGDPKRQTKEVQPELFWFFQWQIIPSNFCETLRQQKAWQRTRPQLQGKGLDFLLWHFLEFLPQKNQAVSFVSQGKNLLQNPWVLRKLFFTNNCHISVLYFEEHELWSFQQNPLTVPAEALFGKIWSYWPCHHGSKWTILQQPNMGIRIGSKSILYIDIYMYISTNELWICPWVNMSKRKMYIIYRILPKVSTTINHSMNIYYLSHCLQVSMSLFPRLPGRLCCHFSPRCWPSRSQRRDSIGDYRSPVIWDWGSNFCWWEECCSATPLPLHTPQKVVFANKVGFSFRRVAVVHIYIYIAKVDVSWYL